MAPPSQGLIFVTKTAKRSQLLVHLKRLFSSSKQNPPEPIPNRPLRGERPSSSNNPSRDAAASRSQASSDAIFSATDTTDTTNNSKSDHSFLERFKLDLGNTKDSKPQALQPKQQQKPTAEPLPPPEDADEIFKKMKETGLIPNAVAMLDGLCKDGLVQEAMQLFTMMREKGTIPEVVIYTAVVEGFCKAHKFDDAKRVFRKMQSNGVSANAFSYTVLIQGLYKCNKLEDAVEFCVEMLESGHSPNISTFVGLVDAFCREKGVEEAREIIETCRQKGYVVNDKAVKEFMDKKAPFPSLAWEAIFKKKTLQKPF